MKRVLTFSLWGNNPTYTIGAIENAKLALKYYNGFECWFYIHTETVPQEIITSLSKISNVKIIHKDGVLPECNPRCWRFEAIDDPDVEIMMSRDTDTRILPREMLAVDEWLESGKSFHIMRDHPYHGSLILAGMFGTKKIETIPSWKSLIDKIVQTDDRNYDQDFLKQFIYPEILNNSIIHASFYKVESHCKNFPIPYDSEYRFVGEYVYSDNSRSDFHITELKNRLKSTMKIYVVSCNAGRVVRLKTASLPLNLNFEVVDSPWYTDEEVQRRGKECFENNMSYPTGFAGTLGHLRAMKRFLETQDELCMIIEDDVRFHKNFNNIVPYVETYMLQTKYDIFSLGFVNISSSSYGNTVIRLVDRDVVEHVNISNPWGCQCYMVSRAYATKLVNLFSNDNIYEVYKKTFVTDHVLFDSNGLGCKRSTFVIPVVAEHPDEITLAGSTNKPLLFNEKILYRHQFYL